MRDDEMEEDEERYLEIAMNVDMEERELQS